MYLLSVIYFPQLEVKLFCGWVSLFVLFADVSTAPGVCVCMCVCMCVLVAQSCATVCNPVDCSFPGSSVHGILQARVLEWVAFPFFR